MRPENAVALHSLALICDVVHRPCSLLAPGASVPRHLHPHAYATVVLEGGYQEAGESGRWRVVAGDVLLHAPFSAHCDHILARGARVLNLPAPTQLSRSACGRIADPDLVVRLAEHNPLDAAAALLESWRPGDGGLTDAPDLLAHALAAPGGAGVQVWALAHGVSRTTAFRWFRSIYGVGPARYRSEARARRAWQLIVEGSVGLAELAAATGYADQAHMSRGVKAFTGRSPGAWRRARLQPSFKTGRRAV